MAFDTPIIFLCGNWNDGIPSGIIEKKEVDNLIYEGNEFINWGYFEVTNINIVEGKAEGKVETLSYDGIYSEQGIFENWEDEQSQVILHEFRGGKVIPFEIITEDGIKNVYEARKDTYGDWISYKERDCGHSYIWK